jgi:DNA invertase Pin-like site-specific DNA recombinase
MSEPTPVVSYARISSDLRGDEHGVQDQHKLNRETAARHGWAVVFEFTDNDKSAAKAGVFRDAFEAMLKALKAGKLPDGTQIHGVVIVAEDRLARRPGDYERFVEAITFRDGRVFADAKQAKDLYSEDTESMGLFGAVISKMEVRKMQRRMRRSHRARAEQGQAVGGFRPFGWQTDRLALDPVEAPLLRDAVLDVIGGRSVPSIVRQWQQLGVRTTRGNEWTRRSLKAAMLNPRMCGWRELNGELVLDANGEPVVGRWRAIVTPEQWQAVKALFDRRAGRQIYSDGTIGDIVPQDQREHRYLLSGILRCGRPKDDGTLCNTPLRVVSHKGRQGHVYLCPGRANGGCGGLARRGDLVDLFISELLLAAMDRADLAVSGEVAPWAGERELRETREKLEELSKQWRMGTITNDLFFKLAPQLEHRLHELRKESATYSAAVQRRRSRASTFGQEIRRRWNQSEDEGGMSISAKRDLLREAFHAVIVHPVGKGKGSRGTFDPDKLEPIWRED